MNDVNHMSKSAGELSVQARKALQIMKPYSPGKPIWEVQQELGLDKVVKLASNENPLGASPKAVEAIMHYLPEIHRYPDAQAAGLREAIASRLQLNPEQLVVSNGADELITLISEAFLEQGDEIIASSPTFSEYEFGANLMGASVVDVPLTNEYGFDVDALLAAVTEQTKIVWICSPNNPTGTYIPKGELQRLLDRLPKRVLVIYDAAYGHYASAGDYTDGLEFVRDGYPILVLQTFSKIFGLAGVRVGFGAAPESLIRHILQVKEPFNVNALAQVAAAAALMDEEHVAASRRLNEQGREQLYRAFERLGLPYTESSSNFVLVQLGPDAANLYERLLRLGVIVRYGGAWGLTEHVRVTVGTEEENDFLIECLAAL